MTVNFQRSGLVVLWDDTYANLLDLAEAVDLELPFSCRVGSCMTCETKLLSGTVKYEPEPFAEVPTGWVLPCCSRPTSAITLDI